MRMDKKEGTLYQISNDVRLLEQKYARRPHKIT